MESTGNPQLQLAFDFVQFTGRNIFLTGKAGTGKTTFLHNLKKNSPKRMIVVAPTGVAAINAGGMTIHSFFQMPFGPHIPTGEQNNPPPSGFQKFSRDKINIMRSLDLLVIDEISMVRADVLDGIDEVLRRYKDRYKPFGGIQLLMIGDLQQLAPVVKEDEWDILKKYYDSVFFFSSRALQKTQHVSIELKHIYRQSDDAFIQILNKVRENKVDAATLVELNKRYIPGFALKAGDGYITLTTHNYQAQELNISRLNKLPANAQNFVATVEGDFPEYAYPTEFELSLKEGAQVMFVKNDISREKLFYNGKIGTIVSFEENTIFVKCASDPDPIAVEKAEWQNTKYTINEETKEIKEDVAGTFVQYPLKLAWAITIHKSQGLTFEKAIIDANAAFAHGQVYVALSRCKTIEGMVLSSPISTNCIKSDVTISGFIKEVEQNPPGQRQLEESKQAYQQLLVADLFDFNPLQRRLSYVLKLMNENLPSIHVSFKDTFDRMNASVKTELADVSEKFRMQVQQLQSLQQDIEKNEQLQKRIKSASTYFADKLESLVCHVIKQLTIDIDNKTVRKTITDAIGRTREETDIKLAGLKACKDGFFVKKYLEAKAKSAIEKPVAKLAKKTSEDYGSTPVGHPLLYARLKEWRKEKAATTNAPVFMVLPQKALMDLITFLPLSSPELMNIKGFGLKKVKQYGDEILQIISAYCKENDIESQGQDSSLPKPKQVQEKIPKTDTKLVTYHLYQSGKTIEEIATERNLAASTIEGHLAHYVGTGELDILQLVKPEKIALITDYFSHNDSYLLGPAKAELGDSVSFGELRLVAKYLEYKNKI
jgi:hypothetical protein